MRTGMGTETETRAVVRMRTGTRMGTGTGTRTGSGRAEERQRSATSRIRTVDAIRHFYSARVFICADKGQRLWAPDTSVRKAWCLYTRIARGGNRVRGTEGANGVGGGIGVGDGNRDGNGESFNDWGGARMSQICPHFGRGKYEIVQVPGEMS